jgi:hypothetical protein
MRKSRRIWGGAVAFLVVAAVVAAAMSSRCELFRRLCTQTKPYVPAPVTVYPKSSGLSRTVIAPTLDAEIPEGKNVVWCASFQLAWDHLGRDVLHGPPVVANADKVVSQLNAGTFSETDLPDAGWFATAGLTRDGIVDAICREMQRRFQKKPEIDISNPENAIVAYGYLEASVPFRIPFFENPKPLAFHDGKDKTTNVSSFGIRDSNGRSRLLREQVNILYARFYIRDPRFYTLKDRTQMFDEFVIDPCKDSSPNQMILACVKPAKTLKDTIARIEELIAGKREDSHDVKFHRGEPDDGDVLEIPNMAWEVAHHFAGLEGMDKRLLNKGFDGLYIGNAV